MTRNENCFMSAAKFVTANDLKLVGLLGSNRKDSYERLRQLFFPKPDDPSKNFPSIDEEYFKDEE